MASKRNALSSLFPGFDPRLFIGFRFLPTYEDGITIVEIKNAGHVKLLPIFEEDADLFRRPPEKLKECYCFTKLESLGTNKVNRTLPDGRRFWKNIHKEEVVVKNIFIGCVTKLRLHEDKNTPTEWHILEYRDRKTAADAARYVLCRIYKIEKKKVSSMNQDQIPGGSQYGYPPPGDVVYNPQPFPSCTYSNGGIDTSSGFDPDDWNNGFLNGDLDPSDFDMDF